MFNMGFTELILFAVIALIFIGPKQLPEIARVIARTLNEFKRAASDITKPMNKIKEDVREEIQQVAEKIKIEDLDINLTSDVEVLKQRLEEAVSLKDERKESKKEGQKS